MRVISLNRCWQVFIGVYVMRRLASLIGCGGVSSHLKPTTHSARSHVASEVECFYGITHQHLQMELI